MIVGPKDIEEIKAILVAKFDLVYKSLKRTLGPEQVHNVVTWGPKYGITFDEALSQIAKGIWAARDWKILKEQPGPSVITMCLFYLPRRYGHILTIECFRQFWSGHNANAVLLEVFARASAFGPEDSKSNLPFIWRRIVSLLESTLNIAPTQTFYGENNHAIEGLFHEAEPHFKSHMDIISETCHEKAKLACSTWRLQITAFKLGERYYMHCPSKPMSNMKDWLGLFLSFSLQREENNAPPRYPILPLIERAMLMHKTLTFTREEVEFARQIANKICTKNYLLPVFVPMFMEVMESQKPGILSVLISSNQSPFARKSIKTNI